MHALHRDLQSKYQRSLEDIYHLETSNTQMNKLVNEQKSELVHLRSDKVEATSKILYHEERIKQLLLECELKQRQSYDLEFKLVKANGEIEGHQLSFKNIERELSEVRLRMEANQSLIEGLTSEKNHLDLSLKESNDQRL